jgi:hypothetical protein
VSDRTFGVLLVAGFCAACGAVRAAPDGWLQVMVGVLATAGLAAVVGLVIDGADPE